MGKEYKRLMKALSNTKYQTLYELAVEILWGLMNRILESEDYYYGFRDDILEFYVDIYRPMIVKKNE